MLAALMGIVLGLLSAEPQDAANAAPPNVLFIAIDDMNDWVGCLDGHPQADTPNLDQLARRGTLFANAHCQAPLCNPSRTSVMTGLRPSTTGVYGLSPSFRTVDSLKDWTSLPQFFSQHGYRTLGAGKIYHGLGAKQLKGEFDVYGPPAHVGAKPPHKLIPPTPNGDHPLMDWGTFPHRDEDKGDYQIASWASEQLRTMKKDKPFFLAVGFSLPHVPCYVTEKWMEGIPDDDSILPPTTSGDRDDVPPFAWYLHWQLPEPRLKWLQENRQWRNLVRSYLASNRFVDAQVGRVLDALRESGLDENTIVVVWSDHGYHLGEKDISGKNTLWERSTRVPLVFAGPGIKPGQVCTQPAELLDIYPTLAQLCHYPIPKGLEGHSLVPQLEDASATRPWPAITTHNQGNHTVRSERYRYIRYADGSEELYDMQEDPNEWNNLAGESSMAKEKGELAAALPKVDARPVAGSAHRVLTYDPKTRQATWEGKEIAPGSAVPD